MRSNFNTAPTTAPEIGTSSWDFGQPISAGIPDSPGGYNDWGAPTAPDNDWGSGWNMPQSSYESTVVTTQESRVSERLRELRDTVVHGLGRKALDAVMNRLPSLGGTKDTLQAVATNAYENPGQIQQFADVATGTWDNRASHIDIAKSVAMGAGLEVAGAGVAAAKESVMKYYGLEKDENEKIRIARKIKFGKAVVKTVVMPVGTATSVGVRAGMSAKKAARKEAVNQIKTGWNQSSFYAYNSMNTMPSGTSSVYESSGW